MTDSVTVIRSRYLRLAKVIHADGRTQDYDQAKTIDFFSMPSNSLDDIHTLLIRLLPRPDCAVVFGGIVDPNRAQRVRRLAHPDPETGDQPTLCAVPRRWCALDMDGIERPADVPARDLAACAALAIERLPAAFHAARCIVQASASHGIKPGCRLRLWFWLDRPTTGHELGFWLDWKRYPVDPCAFRPAQPIYTAAPVLVGRVDHLPSRLALLRGADAVAVPAPEALKPPERPAPPARGTGGASPNDAQAFIDDVLARVRVAADGAKHDTLRKAARLLGGIQAEARFSDSEALQWLMDVLPDSAKDRIAARKTAEWGLDFGRRDPLAVPRQWTEEDRAHRSETAREAFRLLRAGFADADLLRRLHMQNHQRSNPLPATDIDATAIWAAQQMRARHAQG